MKTHTTFNCSRTILPVCFSLFFCLGAGAQPIIWDTVPEEPVQPDVELPGELDDENGYTPGTFTILTDQDFLYVTPRSKNEDRNYTQGTAFIYANLALLRSPFYWPLKKIGDYSNRLAGKQDKDAFEAVNSSFALGGTAFTPRIIDSINPVVGDRPFAFLFYVSTSATFARDKTFARFKKNKTITVYHTYTINGGMFGTNLGYEFQSFAHKHIVQGRPTDPKGWHTQISNGGSPTILLEYSRFRPLLSFPSAEMMGKHSSRSIVDLGWNFGGSVGYYDRVFNSLYARVGFLKRDTQAKWNGCFSSLNNASYQKTDPSDNFWDKLEVFGYGKLTSTFMFRNAMLVGQRFHKNEYTLDPDWVKTAVFELEWGVVVAFEYEHKGEPRSYALLFRQVMRSPEFDSKLFPVRSHYFGSLGLIIPVR